MMKLQIARMMQLALTNDATTVFEIRRLALLLSELKRFEDATPALAADCRFQTRLSSDTIASSTMCRPVK